MCTCVNWAKKVPRSVVGKNFNFFDFSKKKIRKWRKSLKATKIEKFTQSFIWIKNMHMCEMSQKGPHVRGGRISIFRFFFKVFENEANHHNFSPGQLKYKISLIWMKTVHMCELSHKGPQVCGGRKLQFFLFFEKFSKMKEIIIFSLQDNYIITRGPRATGRSPEWHSHCRYADVMQHFFQSCHRN